MKRATRHNVSALAVILGLLLMAAATPATAQEDIYAPKDDGVPDGYMIIQGDIIVPVDYYDRGIQPQGTFDSNQWGLTVPYEFDANVNATNRTRTRDALDEIEAVCAVNFVLRSGQGDYIHVQNSTKNSSSVGRKGGGQNLNIVSWGSRFIIVHEFLHALGFWHEQSRPDRDTYVTINLGRVQDDKEGNFDKKGSSDVYGGYDFDSVMHYGQCAFSTCGSCGSNLGSCRTITVKPAWAADWQSNIGQRARLSDLDILTLQMLYPASGTVFIDRNYTGFFEFGVFRFPFDTFKEGASAVAAGRVIIAQPGTYSGSGGLYTKRMYIRAPRGGVRIKQ